MTGIDIFCSDLLVHDDAMAVEELMGSQSQSQSQSSQPHHIDNQSYIPYTDDDAARETSEMKQVGFHCAHSPSKDESGLLTYPSEETRLWRAKTAWTAPEGIDVNTDTVLPTSPPHYEYEQQLPATSEPGLDSSAIKHTVFGGQSPTTVLSTARHLPAQYKQELATAHLIELVLEDEEASSVSCAQSDSSVIRAGVSVLAHSSADSGDEAVRDGGHMYPSNSSMSSNSSAQPHLIISGQATAIKKFNPNSDGYVEQAHPKLRAA